MWSWDLIDDIHHEWRKWLRAYQAKRHQLNQYLPSYIDCARLQQSNGDTAALYWTIDMMSHDITDYNELIGILCNMLFFVRNLDAIQPRNCPSYNWWVWAPEKHLFLMNWCKGWCWHIHSSTMFFLFYKIQNYYFTINTVKSLISDAL